MAEDSSTATTQIIVNRKTEKLVDQKRTVSEKIEQTQRNYYPGSNVPEHITSRTSTFILREPNQTSSSSSSTGTPTSGPGATVTNSEEYIQRRVIAIPKKTTAMTETTGDNTGSSSSGTGNNSSSSTTNGQNSQDSKVHHDNNGHLDQIPEESNGGGVQTSVSGGAIPDNAQLISRTTQQVQTQQVKTITKVYTTREIRHIGPDGQPIDGPYTNDSTNQQSQQVNTTNDYTNFPGPRMAGNPGDPSGDPNFHNPITSDAMYNAQFHDPHYSNTNFSQQQQQQQQQHHLMNPAQNMAPSPSPGSGSTTNTGSTAAATFVTSGPNVPQGARMYDPYARNSQIGYQDYSNFQNYQDLSHLGVDQNGQPTLVSGPPGASPQPPIRRHIMSAELADPNYVQYGYVPGNPGGMVPTSTLPIQLNQTGMHSPGGGGGGAIYGNFEEAPQGYLDRRQTFDDHSPYGQMMARGPPGSVPPAMYEDAESAYQHLQALQQAGVIDPAQSALFFQNGMHLPPGTVQGVPPSRAVLGGAGVPGGPGGAPGSSAVTAIGPDGVRWRDPDLHEVIDFLTHPNSIVRANAAAYLQHLCFMDDSMKAKTRALGGIPALVSLLAQDVPEIQRNACGALRNLSYGRQNDENKRAIRAASGIPSLVRLLRKTPDNEIRELVTSVLWNLSSSEELKRPIIDDALGILVTAVIIPHSGWDRAQAATQAGQQAPPPEIYWSTVFRNASGVLRNVSSSGEYARRRLREVDGLVDSLLYLVRAAIGKNDMDNKSVENCVCILRNLSYRCQEVVDPDYDKHPPGVTSPSGTSSSAANTSGANFSSTPTSSSSHGQSPASTLSPSSSSSSKNSTSSLMGGLSSKVGENLSCFGGSKKNKSKHGHGHDHHAHNALSPSASVNALEAKTATLSLNSNGQSRSEVPKGMELLWQTEVVQPYLALLSECSNPETLEAAAGAIQNLAACYWQPSIDIRGAVRKEKGLPILVELLRMEVDRVVCAVATALRNLAMDTRNKELIGKYALKDLVSKLPTPSATGVPLETGTSDDTVAAVLATLNEVIARNPDFAKSLLEASGMQRLSLITKHRNRYSSRVVKFTSQLLYNMWQHTELREVYRKAGWKESHFIVANPNTVRSNTGTLRNGPSGMMTPSASQMMMTPSSPTSANGTLPSGMYHSISANNTLSRPMSTVGGTKYEDHHTVMAQMRAQSGGGTLPRQGQMMQARMTEEMVMSDLQAQQQQMLQAQLDNAAAAMMTNGTGTLVRPPIGGVPIFSPGAAPGEPVYAQVNRERKRQQQQQAQAQLQQAQAQAQVQAQAAAQHSPSGGGVVRNSPVTHHPAGIGAPPPPNPNDPPSNYHNVLLDPSNNEPIYPPSMPAGDSWV